MKGLGLRDVSQFSQNHQNRKMVFCFTVIALVSDNGEQLALKFIKDKQFRTFAS